MLPGGHLRYNRRQFRVDNHLVKVGKRHLQLLGQGPGNRELVDITQFLQRLAYLEALFFSKVKRLLQLGRGDQSCLYQDITESFSLNFLCHRRGVCNFPLTLVFSPG